MTLETVQKTTAPPPPTLSPSTATNKGVGGQGPSLSKALKCLLKEDPLLQQYSLTTISNHNNTNDDSKSSSAPAKGAEPPAFSYAAALLKSDGDNDDFFQEEEDDDDDDDDDLYEVVDVDNDDDVNQKENKGKTSKANNGKNSSTNIQQKAQEALSEVDRKLALVESLSERISREKPEHVAGPLLKLHGYNVISEDDNNYDTNNGDDTTTATTTTNTTIASTLDRCDRLKRQAQVLDSVANRVESTLVRGLDRMSLATGKLDRVLKTSQVLKMIMRLRFEAKKVMGSGLDFDALLEEQSNDSSASSSTTAYIDLRDLTRAAASVSIMEELLNHEELKGKGIDLVEQMRPEAESVARAVRKAAAGLLAEQQDSASSGSNSTVISAAKLGATLQVYYHLGELPDAAWNAVCLGLKKAESANESFLKPFAIRELLQSARSEAKKVADDEIASIKITDKKQKESIHERSLKKKMRDLKAQAATTWAHGISDAALQVWNLHRVLSRKSDPVTREKFLDVVNSAPIPKMFEEAQQLLKRQQGDQKQSKISIFPLFWNQMCISVGLQLEELLEYEKGSLAPDVATFYPAIRAAALEMLNYIQETMQAGSLSSTNMIDDIGGANSATGIMGGSEALDDAIFFGWGDNKNLSNIGGGLHDGDELGGSGFGSVSADTWTRPEASTDKTAKSDSKRSASSAQTSSALSSILTSPEWFALQGTGSIGLYPMQRAFVTALKDRLNAPLKRMFVENRVVDENGIDMKMLPTLPSPKDLKNIETCLRNELSLADPREGGGEFNMTTMISESIVDMVENFCELAKGATSGISEEDMLHETKGSATEELAHDMKVAAVMASLTVSLRSLPENTFVKPYRPAHSLQHEEAANMCQIALLPAIHEIETLVKKKLLNPLCRVLNKRIGAEIAYMHRGLYVESISSGTSEGSFVQEHIASVYDSIATNILSRLPEEYGSMVSSTLATFSIYCFVSNASLIRPLGETGRLKITQDLGDLELTLEQLMFKSGSSIALNQINEGKPYAELRAVRQMLFWNGLDNKQLSSEQVSKVLFREPWVKDVRPSIVFHFLLTFAPRLLSSPHHSNHVSAAEYVKSLVNFDGSVDDGESLSWMTTMKSCDSYQQRESIDGRNGEGDRRIPAMLMMIGPELLRRRRQ